MSDTRPSIPVYYRTTNLPPVYLRLEAVSDTGVSIFTGYAEGFGPTYLATSSRETLKAMALSTIEEFAAAREQRERELVLKHIGAGTVAV